jgi:DNA-binding protein YbaB
MVTPSYRPVALLVAVVLVSLAGRAPVAAQNPITAAREAFRKAQEEAKRKAKEEAEKRLPGAQPAGQPSGQPTEPPAATSGRAPGGPTGQPSVVQSGDTPKSVGTAETTAKFAKAATFIDVAGLKLGMPLQDAPAVLKGLNLRPMREPQVETVWPLDPTGVETQYPPNAPRSVHLVEYLATDGQGVTEAVTLIATKHPNPSVVTSIERKVVYRAGQGPVRDTVLAGLRQKYGPESLVVSDVGGRPNKFLTLRWYFDEQRQALQGNLAKQASACDGGAGGTLCGTLTAIDVSVVSSDADVVTELTVHAVNRPLTRSAEEATQAFLRQMDEARREQQRLNSSKRAAPKL